jgi:hypothetical protein
MQVLPGKEKPSGKEGAEMSREYVPIWKRLTAFMVCCIVVYIAISLLCGTAEWFGKKGHEIETIFSLVMVFGAIALCFFEEENEINP